MSPDAHTPRADAIPHTTHAGMARAHEVYSGDWDRDGTVSVHLPRAVAERLLQTRGWRLRHGRRGAVRWETSTGETVWDTEAALQLALAAECP